MHERIAGGGTLLAFGNGGSATDANDLVLDCVDPPPGLRPIPAISLSLEPANISAISNDVGVELVFLRQMIANGRPGDIAVAISTSGKSKNICAALGEARKRGLLTIALLGSDGGDILAWAAGRLCAGGALRLHPEDSRGAGLDLSRVSPGRCWRVWVKPPR